MNYFNRSVDDALKHAESQRFYALPDAPNLCADLIILADEVLRLRANENAGTLAPASPLHPSTKEPVMATDKPEDSTAEAGRAIKIIAGALAEVGDEPVMTDSWKAFVPEAERVWREFKAAQGGQHVHHFEFVPGRLEGDPYRCACGTEDSLV